jgi:hypothetical protein
MSWWLVALYELHEIASKPLISYRPHLKLCSLRMIIKLEQTWKKQVLPDFLFLGLQEPQTAASW